MTPQDMLYAYVDGELDPAAEGQLFAYLLEHDRLRSELRGLLRLRSEMQDNMLYPPPEMQNRILRTVGLIDAPLESVGAAAQAIDADARKRRNRVMGYLLAGLGGACIVALLFMFLPLNVENPGFAAAHYAGPSWQGVAASTSRGITQQSQSLDAGSPSHLKSGPEIRSGFVAPEGKVRSNPTPAEPGITLSMPTQGVDAEVVSAKSAIRLSQATISYAQYTSVGAQPLERGERSFAVPAITPMLKAQSGSRSFLKDISFAMRGFTAQSFPEPVTEPQSRPFFNNAALGIFYPLSDRHTVGIEFGQEPFSQVFNGTDNGRAIEIRQNLFLPWVGVAYRYDPYKISSLHGVRPFGRILAGASDVGPLGRVMIGVEDQTGYVSIMLGVEASTLAYRYQGRWFVSPKLGITYGLRVRL